MRNTADVVGSSCRQNARRGNGRPSQFAASPRSLCPRTMARSIQCIECGAVLNLPDQAAGRRLKCPRCGAKFVVPTDGAAPQPAGPDSGTKKGPDTTFVLTRKQSSIDLPVMPTAPGDLRDTFDLESMTGAAPPSAEPVPLAPGSGGREAADALALFEEKPTRPRRKSGAEARATARRCPTCGGVVSVGMSICNSCGLDLDTGTRVDLADDLAPPPAPRDEGLPIPMTILGGLSFALSVALAVAALIVWQKGLSGAEYFIPVAAFGGYAAVQFLRGKSVRMLMAALTIGAVIDVAALVAVPIYEANADTKVFQRKEPSDDPDAAPEIIQSPYERLDVQRIKLGIALLALYAATSVYLLSPTVQKHFRK
jgi:DNA-directed RNA polymerase subunit RPC12/RpoP